MAPLMLTVCLLYCARLYCILLLLGVIKDDDDDDDDDITTVQDGNR